MVGRVAGMVIMVQGTRNKDMKCEWLSRCCNTSTMWRWVYGRVEAMQCEATRWMFIMGGIGSLSVEYWLVRWGFSSVRLGPGAKTGVWYCQYSAGR